MALIRFSLSEAVAVIKQNISLPAAISNVSATNREIEITTVYGLTFFVAYKSFTNGWLELKVKGAGLIGKLISITLGAKLLDILAPQLIASGVAQTRGQSVFLDTYELLRGVRGLQIREIRTEGDCLAILADIENCP